MKKILILLLSIISIGSYGQNTDAQNTTIFNVIRNETAQGGNTRARVADAYEALNGSKANRAEVITASGTNTYTATASPAITSYINGLRLLIKFTNANSGASTLNVNSLGAIPITKAVSSALSTGDILAGQILWLAYDGTNFQIAGGSGSGGGSFWPLTGTATLTGGVSMEGNQVLQFGASTALTAFKAYGASVVLGYPNVSPTSSLTFGASGATFVGPTILATSTTSLAPLTIPHGVAPSSPSNGNIWSTTSGFFGQVNGATVGPFSSGTVATGGTGVTSLTTYSLITGGTTGTGPIQQIGIGVAGQALVSNGAGALPSFQNISGGGISGLTANRMPYATSPTALGDVAEMTWDNTNKAPTFNSFTITMRGTNGAKGTYAGYQAGNFNTITTTDGFNTGFGYQVFNSIADDATFTNSSYGTAFGYQAGKALITGPQNSLFGYLAGNSLTDGYSNSFFGYRAGASGAHTYNNAAFGSNSLRSITTGYQNTAVGEQTGAGITTGHQNVNVGYLTGPGGTSSYNVFVGSEAGEAQTSGSNNVGVGYLAGYLVTNSNGNNTFVGASSGTRGGSNAVSTGGGNTYIGAASGPGSSTQFDNSTGLGINAEVLSSRSMVFGANQASGMRPNYGFGGESYGSGFGVMYLVDASTNPTTAASSGNYWYSKGGTIYFAPNTTVPGLNVGSFAGNPSTLDDGDIWYNSSSGALNARINGSTVSLSSGGSGSAPFTDATAILKNSSDATKLLRFDLSGYTTGTTRVLTPPNFDGTIATINNAQTWTAVQTFSSAPVVPTGSPGAGGTNASSQAYVDAAVTAASLTTPIVGTYGGTGTNNGSSTITVSGNITIGSSTNTVAFVTGGNTSVTLPASGTLATLAGSETLSTKTLTAPKFVNGGFIADANGNELFIFTTTASAVNEVTFTNAATANNPKLTASGGDSNVGMDWLTKGTGTFRFTGNSTQAATIRLYEDTDDGTNFSSFKVGTQSSDLSYTLPVAAAASDGSYMSTTTAGVMSWIEALTPSNGLTTTSTTLKLGGDLTANTTISGAFDLTFANNNVFLPTTWNNGATGINANGNTIGIGGVSLSGVSNLAFYNGTITTVPISGFSIASTLGDPRIFNANSVIYSIGGAAFDDFADVNNTTTTETDLYTHTIIANTLSTNGDKLLARYAGKFNDLTATCQLRIYFGGTLIGDTGLLTVSSLTADWSAEVFIIRTGTTTVRADVKIFTPGTGTASYTNETDMTGLTLSSTNILKITGTAAGASGGSSDITAKLGTISFIPSAP